MEHTNMPEVVKNAIAEQTAEAKKTVKRAAITIGISLSIFAALSVLEHRLNADENDDDTELND